MDKEKLMTLTVEELAGKVIALQERAERADKSMAGWIELYDKLCKRHASLREAISGIIGLTN